MRDYDFYVHLDSWDLVTAVLLVGDRAGMSLFECLVELDIKRRPIWGKSTISRSSAVKSSDAYAMAVASIRAGGLEATKDGDEYVVQPGSYVRWADSRGLRVPRPLRPLLDMIAPTPSSAAVADTGPRSPKRGASAPGDDTIAVAKVIEFLVDRKGFSPAAAKSRVYRAKGRGHLPTIESGKGICFERGRALAWIDEQEKRRPPYDPLDVE